MPTTTQSATPATLPAGVTLALDVVGTPAAPTTGDGIPYSKLDVGAAGASSPVTAANPLPVALPAATVTTLTPPAAITGFALEGGHLAAIDTSTAKIPSQGQALAAGSVPVVLTAIQQAALTPPAAIAGFALEAGHLAAIDTSTAKIPSQGQALAAGSVPVVLTAIQQTALTPPAAITGFATETTLAGRLKPADTLAAVTNLAQLAGTAPVMKAASTAAAATDVSLVVGLSPNSPVYHKASDNYVTATGAANAAVTLTLGAAGSGLFHYITSLHIQRTATAALAGTATLVITSTNITGSPAWSVGNAMVAGGTQNDLVIVFASPIKTTTAATATTIVAPAPGAAVLWRINATYYTAP